MIDDDFDSQKDGAFFKIGTYILLTNLGHMPHVYAHFGVSLPFFVSNLGPQDKLLKQTPPPTPQPISLFQVSAPDQAILTGHMPHVYAHFGGSLPCFVPDLGPQDKALTQKSPPTPQFISSFHVLAPG